MQYFAKTEYERVVYLNFETRPTLASLFTNANSLDPQQIIKLLIIETKINIEPGNTLIIFDEVQQCPCMAINCFRSLKAHYTAQALAATDTDLYYWSSGLPVNKKVCKVTLTNTILIYMRIKSRK